jgi:hypothetical protein
MTEQTTTNTVWQDGHIVASYAAPLKRQWTGLTDAQIHKVNEDFEQDHGSLAHTRAIEAKLKELNQ